MKHTSLLTSGLLLLQWLGANSITVSNTTLNATKSDGIKITFDLSWQNSWYLTSGTPQNHDAAWVFAKYRVNNGNWLHLPVDATGTAPYPATLDIKEGVGVMVYNNTVAGTGPAAYPGITLISTTAASAYTPGDQVDVRVFAIEMVHVPQGQFMLGNNKLSGSDNETRGFSDGDGGYLVSSEGAINVSASDKSPVPNTLQANSATVTVGTIPAAYPKGFDAFYCMKYEVSQALWVSFFNTLTATQRSARDITAAGGKNSDGVVNRNGVAYSGTGEATTTLPAVPINFVSRNDAMAFLDWAALRPMTELEYEKAAKGPATPSPGWFAWGNSTIKQGARYALASAGTTTETVTSGTFATSVGNAVYGGETDNPNVIGSTTASQGPVYPSGTVGPFRVGIFAGSTTPATRVQAGASYYGIMELSGNVAEGVITVANAAAQSYTGNHGDGTLSAAGAQDEGWPTGVAIGYRGGWFSGDVTYLMTADRSLIGSSPNTDTSTNHQTSSAENARLNYYQMRGVRD